MPTLDDELHRRFEQADGPADPGPDVLPSIARRHRRRLVRQRVQAVALAACVLVGTVGGFVVLQRAFSGTDTTVPRSPSPSVSAGGELGLGFPVCRVTSMPIATASGEGTAWVFTRSSDEGCPTRSDGFSGVAVDVDGDGAADASAGPLEDCFFQCEAFAAPDVDGDGRSEVIVSTEGADGYGLWLYHVSADAPALVPVQVANDLSDRPADGPFEFAWVGAAAHREYATCGTNAEGAPTFVLQSIDVGEPGATITSITVIVTGSSATVADVSERTVSLADLEQMGQIPPGEICGVPILAEDAPTSPPPPAEEGSDIGLGTNVCQPERLDGLDLVGDGDSDTAWTGYLVNDAGRCPEDTERQEWIVAVDVTGDRLADASTASTLVNCPYVGCRPLGGIDLDVDGNQELVVTTGFSIQDQGYFEVRRTGDGITIEPIDVAAPGHPPAGLEGGQPLITSSGGDAGYSAWVRCETYPESPVLVFAWTSGDIEGERDHEWHEVAMNLGSDGRFHVVDATDLMLPPRERPSWTLTEAPTCGFDFTY